MAIAFRSATEAGTGSAGTTQVINVPSGVQDGDFLLAVIGTADGDTGSVSLSGTWQGPIVNNLNTGGSAPSPPGVSVYWRIASSEPASYTITDTESSGIAGQMLAFTGVDETTPIDVTTTTATGDGSNANPPSINYADTGAAIVVGAWWDSTTAVYSAVPSGYTSPDSLGAIVGNGGGNGLSLATAYDLTPAGDPEDPGTFTSSAEQWGSFTVALRAGPVDGAGMTLATAQFTQATAAAENPGTFDFEKSLPWGGITLALRQVAGVATKALSPTAKFDTITTTGTVTVQDAATIDGLTINADVILEDVVDLTDVTINGDLDIETAGTYDFSNVTVTGDTLNNDSGGNVSINASDGSSIPTSEPGTGNGEVDVQNSVAITIHVTDVSGTDIEDARVEVSATETVGTITDGDVLLTGLTNSSGILETTTFNYEVAFDPTGLDIQVKARKATSSPFYKPALFVGTVTTAGYSISRALISDE